MDARKIYESDEDLKREAIVAEAIESARNVRLKKVPRKYFIDYAVMKDNAIIGWVEIKCRQGQHDRYSTFMLSLCKWREGLKLAEDTKTTFVVAVSYDDGIYLFDATGLKAETVTFGFGGRSDRNDTEDYEPVVHIPIQSFCKLNTVRTA